PDLRIGHAHGQMEGHDLEKRILDFIDRKYDVLVCTNIVESGVDIANVNTIIVNNAHQFGLSDLHQLRGRVGRSNKKAFCYLLAPPISTLPSDSRKRLQTLEQHSDLGSGFRIAMRDLDIRGAGNLLGDEQSGHVAAVGFELYCQMIDDAVEAAGADTDRPEAPEPVRFDVAVDAYLPASYIPFEAAKIDVHRRIAAARAAGELREIRDELDDRFGALPPEAENLLELQRARIELGAAGATSVDFRGGRLSVAGIELDSEQVELLREKVPD